MARRKRRGELKAYTLWFEYNLKRKKGKRKVIRTVVARNKTEAREKARKVKKSLEERLNRKVKLVKIGD